MNYFVLHMNTFVLPVISLYYKVITLYYKLIILYYKTITLYYRSFMLYYRSVSYVKLYGACIVYGFTAIQLCFKMCPFAAQPYWASYIFVLPAQENSRGSRKAAGQQPGQQPAASAQLAATELRDRRRWWTNND